MSPIDELLFRNGFKSSSIVVICNNLLRLVQVV